MLKKPTYLLLLTIAFSGCKKKETSQPTTQIPYTANDQHISVLTQHNDLTRAGWNSQEKKLTTSNVNANQFGKLFTLSVDDQVFAQPLVAANLTMAGEPRNVAYIATVNNSILSWF